MSLWLGTVSSSLVLGPVPIIPTVGSYHHIETLTASTNQSTFDFVSIPNTYKHLQLRTYLRGTRTDASDFLGIRLNNSSSTYYRHSIQSRGAGTPPGVLMDSATYGYIPEAVLSGSSSSNNFGVCVIDVLDYTSTVTHKSILSLSGLNEPALAQSAATTSVLWPSASVVNRVTLICYAQFASGSTVSLYGIDGV